MSWDSEKGEVNGPSSSTDNAVPKFSGTGGDTLENTSVFIDSTAGSKLYVKKDSLLNVHFDQSPTNIIEATEGRLQLISDDSGSVAASMIMTNVPSSGDNKHFVIAQRGVDLSDRVDFMVGQTSASGTIIPANATRVMTFDRTTFDVGVGKTPSNTRLDIEEPGAGKTTCHLASTNESYANTVLFVTADRGDSTSYNLLLIRNDNNGTPQDRMKLDGDGSFALGAYGAGTLVTDSSGNVTASSDASLKENIVDFTTGLDAVKNLRAVKFNWNKESGYNQDDLNVGFIAQEVEPHIPEAVGQTPKGTKTLSDRAIICALLNSVKELSSRIEKIEEIAKGL